MAGMIIVRLCGGLGNQMFQYALGRRLSLERKVALKLDIRLLNADSKRDYALDGFRIESKIASTTELSGLLPWPLHLPRKLAWLPRWPGRIPLRIERGFHFDPDVLEVPDSVCLEGYWQTQRYFVTIADQIRRDFQLFRPMSISRQTNATMIRETMAISVHVRRGDYVANPITQSVHGTCTAEWYEKTMTMMAATVKDPTFFVFSDDPAWARANLPARWPCHFVEPQTDGLDYEDMHLMALCRHHIVANSSFSWWGAWLNPDPDKRVFAPSRWFNRESNDTRDLIPADWLQI